MQAIRLRRIGWWLPMLLALAGCRARYEARHEDADAAPSDAEDAVAEVGQLLIVGISGTEIDEKTRTLFSRVRPGGICLYGANITASSDQVHGLITEIRTLFPAERQPFLAIDEEGGTVSRFESGDLQLPGAMALGATGSPALARRAGAHVGAFLTALGFDMNFAPVLEPTLNPFTRTIGVRGFSADPAVVSELGTAFIMGERSAGILAVAKHFPGHGMTQPDSHFVTPRLALTTLDELDHDTEPFRAAVRAGVDAVMVGHAAIPALTGSDDSIVFSRPLMTDYMRARLGFRGLLVSDALTMLGAGRGALKSRAVEAVAAGVDMLLIPGSSAEGVFDAIVEETRSGRLPRERVLESAMRVRRAHALLHDLRRGAEQTVPTAEVPREVAENSITVLKNEDVLPLEPTSELVLVTSSRHLFQAAGGYGIRRRLIPNAASGTVGMPSELPPSITSDTLEFAAQSRVVIVGLINEEELSVARALLKKRHQLVLLSLGRPTILDAGVEAKALVATYSYSQASAQAALRVVFGIRGASGRLPLPLTTFPAKSGLTLQAVRSH